MSTKASYHCQSSPTLSTTDDLKLAQQFGFNAIELSMDKMSRSASKSILREVEMLPVSMVDVFMPLESYPSESRHAVDLYSEVLATTSAPALQVVVLENFCSTSWRDQRAQIYKAARRLHHDLAISSVRLAIEPVTFGPCDSVSKAIELIDMLGTDVLGLVLDTWHLFTSGEDWDQIASIPPDIIATVQVSDSIPRRGERWTDEDRIVMPGEGIVPLDGILNAIANTGYNGYYSVEVCKPANMSAGRFAQLSKEALEKHVD